MMEMVLDRLNAKRIRQGKYMAKCPVPAHNDRSPSLSISHGRAGRVLMYCFGGCHLEDILRASGLTKLDLFDGPPPSREEIAAANKTREEVEALHLNQSLADREYMVALREGYRERAHALQRVAGKVMQMSNEDPGHDVMNAYLHDLIADARSFDRAIIADPDDFLPSECPVPPDPRYLRPRL